MFKRSGKRTAFTRVLHSRLAEIGRQNGSTDVNYGFAASTNASSAFWAA